MLQAIRRFKNAKPQTKLFIFMGIMYGAAMLWTTVQAYARLAYSRSDVSSPIVIQTNDHT